jgi:hypothetical protein
VPAEWVGRPLDSRGVEADNHLHGAGTVKLGSFEAIVLALNQASVRYLVAGGLAVGAHGYVRFTKDVDFVVQLVPDNIERAFTALGSLGYRPLVPIAAEQFADAMLRESWVRDKGMQVLQFWSDAHPETPVDVFVIEPFQFDEEYERALVKPLFGTIPVRFVTIPTLIRMKEAAGRPQDRIDIEHLRMRLDDNGRE